MRPSGGGLLNPGLRGRRGMSSKEGDGSVDRDASVRMIMEQVFALPPDAISETALKKLSEAVQSTLRRPRLAELPDLTWELTA
jgi:hypothetical protein